MEKLYDEIVSWLDTMMHVMAALFVAPVVILGVALIPLWVQLLTNSWILGILAAIIEYPLVWGFVRKK